MVNDLLIREMIKDIKEIKDHLLELIKQGAVANQTLIEHERRSTNLEARMIPIEKDYSFRSKLYGIVISVFGVGIALYQLFKK